MISRRTGLAVLVGVVLFCSKPVYAQTVPDEKLAEALAGIVSIVNRSEAGYTENAGQNLDGSLTWEYIERGERELLRMVFKNFRYYAAQENPVENRVVALSGDLEMDMYDELLTGAVAVKGIPPVSSLNFVEYGFENGSLEVNGRQYDSSLAEEIFEEALDLIDDGGIITPETEAVLVFVTILMAAEESGLSEAALPEDIDTSGNIPPGITGSNPQGSVKFATRKNAIEISLSGYEGGQEFFDNLFDNLSPLFDGKFVLEYPSESGSLSSVVLHGSIGVKNIPFVSSMRFDSCIFDESTWDEGDEGSAGIITIDDVSHDFRDFIKFLEIMDTW
jgi:hypothetical protein